MVMNAKEQKSSDVEEVPKKEAQKSGYKRKNGSFELPEVDKDGNEDDKSIEKDILVVSNHFPKRLNFFCIPTNPLMTDRLCMGELDAYVLACADNSPPIQLVPFCLGYKHQCADANYPSEEWCDKEFERYEKFCTKEKRHKCAACEDGVSCQCEPYMRLWRRFGFETARWCQKYELICDEKARKDKGDELVQLMKDTIRVHYRCLHLFNLPHVICDPFSSRFDWHRCMKFLFDCELISDWTADEEAQMAKTEQPASSKEESIAKVQESISDTTDELLKAGIPKEKLKENAQIYEKEQQLAELLKTPKQH